MLHMISSTTKKTSEEQNETELNNQSKLTSKQSLEEKRPCKRLASAVRKMTLGCEAADTRQNRKRSVMRVKSVASRMSPLMFCSCSGVKILPPEGSFWTCITIERQAWYSAMLFFNVSKFLFSSMSWSVPFDRSNLDKKMYALNL